MNGIKNQRGLLVSPLFAFLIIGGFLFSGTGLTGCGGYNCEITIETLALPDGVAGIEYMFDLKLKTEDCGYTSSDDVNRDWLWSTISGSLPPGISLNSSGEIRGTPTLAGVYTFTVSAKDPDDSDSVDKGFALTIN